MAISFLKVLEDGNRRGEGALEKKVTLWGVGALEKKVTLWEVGALEKKVTL